MGHTEPWEEHQSSGTMTANDWFVIADSLDTNDLTTVHQYCSRDRLLFTLWNTCAKFWRDAKLEQAVIAAAPYPLESTPSTSSSTLLVSNSESAGQARFDVSTLLR